MRTLIREVKEVHVEFGSVFLSRSMIEGPKNSCCTKGSCVTVTHRFVSDISKYQTITTNFFNWIVLCDVCEHHGAGGWRMEER
eukprot:scaffold83103_cov50-Cyclotella_meneghiniana.AAC.1